MNDSGERKKTLLIINLYTEMGGNETALLNLLNKINREQFTPVMMFNARGPFVEKVESLGIETVIMPYRTVMLKQLINPATLLQTIISSVKIYHYIRERKIDILQCSDVLSLLLLLSAKLRLNIPVIYNVTFFYEWTRMILFNKLAVIMVKKIVLNSSPVQQDMLAKTLFLKRKMIIIPNGVDMSLYHPLRQNDARPFRTQLNISPNTKLIGMAARFDPAKGHHIFLESAAAILGKRTDVHFVVIGGLLMSDAVPNFRRYHDEVMRRYHELGLEGKLTFAGHRNDMPEVMRELDLLVCPSLREGFGLVIIEALASGVPVVAGNSVGVIGDLPNTVGLFIAENGNISSFIEQIAKALREDSPRPDPASLEAFSWDSSAGAFQNIYSALTRDKE